MRHLALMACVISVLLVTTLSPASAELTCRDLNPDADWAAGTRVELTGPSPGVTWSWLAVESPGPLTLAGNPLLPGDYDNVNLVFDAAPGHYKISLSVYKTGYPASCMDTKCVEFDVGPISCELCNKVFCQSDPMIAGSGTCLDVNPSVMTFPGGTITYPGPDSSLNFKWYWNGISPSNLITSVTGKTLTIDWSDIAATNPAPIPNPIPVGTYKIYLKVWAKGTTEPTGMTCSTTITKVSKPTADIAKTLP